ncbi:tRNA pseudouridine65 synthase [Natronospira proteinivora]|uniref:tRNA pseudouridine synthase C n=1 Tax=Natronospira proteinivora TaxID=1807133 RepID=A0ABT1G8R8_9GAMM|nr:pseudouridine synthase [Natronospira proteinivora]MCP1727714.1 tRNA pseudouridine65 synthase [Natronospira proteinivora]
MNFPILYQDDYLVAARKPADILVHRTALARDRVFMLQSLRDQLGRTLYPVHRLDRATSGVIVFALDSRSAHQLNQAFSEQQVHKQYLAIVRGWPPAQGEINRPVKDDDRAEHRPALSRYRRLAQCELPVPNRRYPTSRYALLELEPMTGRRHQLRIHCERMAYPIIGDTTHGDGEHNRIFREHLGIRRLLLHARTITLPHPAESTRRLTVSCPPGDQFIDAMIGLGWKDWLDNEAKALFRPALEDQ